MFTTRSIRTSYNTLCTKIIRLNLYDSQSPDPNIVFRERLSTRVFLLLLISAVFILTLSTSLSVQVKSKTVTQPTQATYERLLKKYSATLQCPCARIAIPYGTFVNVVPIFHQVCSSHFVSQAWIDFVFATNTTFLWPMDIRTSLSAMWQLISALCQNAKNSLNDAMNQFNNSTLINTMVLSEQVLQAQSAAALDISCRAASSALVRPFIAIEKITQANGFSTGLLLNAIAIIPTTKLKSEADPLWSSVTTYILQGTTNSCFCQINGSCPIPGGLYLYEAWETYGTYNLSRITANITLPGFVFDCLPIMMTLSSSLECFYNESCLKILLSAYSSTINVSVLDNTKPSRFVPTTIVENLINELFVEEILNKTNYTSYYNACAPIYCRYTFSRRFDWIYVVTTMLALVGGLKTILHFITPYAIKLIFFLYRLRRRRSPQVESQANEIIPIRTSLRNSFVRIKQSIIELNFFRARSQNLLYIRQGRIATRLYVVLLTGTISILIVYTSTSMQTVSKTIQSPLQEKYEELQKQYPHTLHCPCSVVAIPYKELIDMVPIYHQLCRSDLVQSWWYQSLYSGLKEAEFHPIHTFPPYFRLMAMLCEVANLTIVAVNHRFSSMMFNNAQVLAEELFDSQMNATIDTLLRSTQAEFVYTMSLINAVLEANQYVSVWKGNTIVMQRNFSKFDSLALSPVKIIAASRTNKVKHGKTCYCVRNAACNLTSLYDEFDSLVIEGVRSISCSVLDSVLQSTLACWYKNDCLNHVRELFSYFDVSISDNVTLLDTMQSYRFPPNTPVRTIVNELMVEQWDRSVSYESFYQKCHPVYCSLTYQKRFHIMYIITTLISVYSCLTIILRLVSKIFVKIVFKCIKSTDLNNEPPTANNEAVSAMTTDDRK